jgi:hypothetical protein
MKSDRTLTFSYLYVADKSMSPVIMAFPAQFGIDR